MKPITMPLPSPELLMKYSELIKDLDCSIEEKTGGILKDIIKCGPRCSSCCERFSLLPLEAAMVQNAANGNTYTDSESRSCVLLNDGLCTVYESRPVICRTQGLAVAYIDSEEGTIEVSACPVSFPPDFEFEMDHLLFLDSFNERLAELNFTYCEESGLEPDKRIPMEDLV